MRRGARARADPRSPCDARFSNSARLALPSLEPNRAPAFLPSFRTQVEQQLEALGADWEVVTSEWFLSLFVNCLPLETTLRVWDVTARTRPPPVLSGHAASLIPY